MAPVELDPDAIDLGPFLRRDDGVIVGNLAAEPTPLVEATWRAAEEVGGLTVFLGMSLHDHGPLIPPEARVLS